MNSLPIYQGNPTVYLDQNILDVFVKNGIGEFGENLKKNYKVVYSDETLKEIKRSTGYENKFLSVLKELEASHLKLILEQPGFLITDQSTITDRDVFQAFEEYCQNQTEYGNIESATQQWLLKYSGGRVGDTIADINEEQKEAFSQLMDDMLKNADELPSDIKNKLAAYSKVMIEQFKSSLKESETLMGADIRDSKNWNGIKEFRGALNIGPKELNNIKPPNILKKIWEMYKSLEPYNNQRVDMEDFFALKINPIYPDRPYYNHQKVTGIYNFLNTLGYFPDSNTHKEKRFVAAMSDNSHAAMATFCHLLLSGDKNFVKKVQAAYEYLNIQTTVKLVVINYV